MSNKEFKDQNGAERAVTVLKHLETVRIVYISQAETFQRTGDPLGLGPSLRERAQEANDAKMWIKEYVPGGPPYAPPETEEGRLLTILTKALQATSELNSSVKGVPYISAVDKRLIDMCLLQLDHLNDIWQRSLRAAQ